METTSYLLLITPVFLSLTLLSHASLILDPSDHKPFIHIQKQLGLPRQKPCSNNGVLCEKRISTHTSILKITHLVFDSQHLKGSLSPFIGNLTELRELTLSNNYLFSQLPSQIINCQKLEILNLKNNRFSGQIPTDLSKLIRLRVLDLSSNQFSGDLSFLNHLPNLEILSLGDNLFTGKIPSALKSFPSLKSNISGNEHIYGPERVQYIPSRTETRSIVPRRYILSQNSTRGSIHTAPAPSPKQHNHSHHGTAKAPSPVTSTSHKHHTHKKVKKGILGFLFGGIAGSILGLFFSLLYRIIVVLARRAKPEGPAIFSPLIKRAEDLAFLENEDGLANLQIVGRGACGEVYKAELPGSNGKLIAIKKVIQPPREAASLTEEESKQLNSKMRQIRSEIQTVGKIRHRNLLALLAHMPRPDCHFLVYEFMKNGSLQDILNQASAGTRELNWLARYKIALGVAVGLEHLHVNNNPKIIHRDLKPANILLDDDMEPRIADFGLAKPMPEDNTHVTSSKWVGTLGYIAPEYHQTLKFTDKCDIYSYGVILGALVVGKFPSDPFFQNTPEMQLVKWMRNKMTSEDPRGAIDPNIRSDGYTEQMLQVLKIACFCTREDPKERPGSKDVRCMLSQIEH